MSLPCRIAFVILAGLCCMTAATAQPFPNKPIRFIVPVPPGGGADFVARNYAIQLSKAFGQQFVIDNRGGAAGIIAMDALAKAPAGVVLLAEGWALSPARMSALHAKVRASAGPETPVKFLVANAGPHNTPASPSPEERREWLRFVDSLRDPEAEVFFFEEPQPA